MEKIEFTNQEADFIFQQLFSSMELNLGAYDGHNDVLNKYCFIELKKLLPIMKKFKAYKNTVNEIDSYYYGIPNELVIIEKIKGHEMSKKLIHLFGEEI